MQTKAILIASVLLLLTIFMPKSEAIIISSVDINFESETAYANLTGENEVEVIFNGTATSTSDEPLTVEIKISTEGNWTYKIEPHPIHLSFGFDEQNFKITIKVPAKANAGDVKVNLTVLITGDISGNTDTGSGPILTIKVGQYYGGKFDIEEKEKKVKSGETAIFNVNITNLGNGEDTFKIGFKDKEKLEKAKWVFKEIQIKLNADETKNTTIEIQTPAEYEGTQEFEIFLISVEKAKKDTNAGEIGDSIKLIVKVEKDKTTFGILTELIRQYIIPIAGVVVLLIVLIAVAVVRRRRKKKERQEILEAEVIGEEKKEITSEETEQKPVEKKKRFSFFKRKKKTE